jgi:hypothetical protein
MEKFSFKVFDRYEFDEAREGDLLSGIIQHGTNQQVGLVKLGRRVKDPQNYKDKETEYKKFVECYLFICKSNESAQQKKPISKLQDRCIIVIFH